MNGPCHRSRRGRSHVGADSPARAVRVRALVRAARVPPPTWDTDGR